ncbi:MAG: hypothetical protein HW421_3189 [Ignavibacteria bacterium]|nr:hypothetical protein [Ignavibacteria bacterium]
MKKLVKIIILFLTLSKSFSEEPFWNVALTPNTGKVYNILVNQNNKLFISSDNGVFSSTNEGGNWLWILEGFNFKLLKDIQGNLFTIQITYSPGSFYGYTYKVLYSTDNGDSWFDSNSFWSGQVSANMITVYKNYLYLILLDYQSQTKYLYRTSNLGNNWELVSKLVSDSLDIDYWGNDFIVNDSIIVLYGRNSNYISSVILSKDLGKTWKKIPLSIKTAIYNMQYYDIKFFIGTDNGLFVSQDTCNTWNLRWFGNEIVYNVLFSNNGKFIICSTSNGIKYSQDSCFSWKKSNEFNDINQRFKSSIPLAIDSLGYCYTSPQLYGIYRSNDTCNNWEKKNKGFSGDAASRILASPDGRNYISSRGLYGSTSEFGNWEFLGYQDLRFSALGVNKNGDIFAGVINEGENDYGVLRSTDKGKSWKNFNKGMNPVDMVSNIVFDSKGYIFTFAGLGWVYRSTDNGESWELLDIEASSLAVNTEGHVFLGTSKQYIFRTTNNGVTWDTLKKGAYNTYDACCMIFHPNKPLGFIYQYKNSSITTDNGRSWFSNDSIKKDDYRIPDAFDSLGNFLSIEGGSYVWRSTDEGKTWYKLDTTGMLSKELGTIAVTSDGHILVGGKYGCVYRSRDAYVSVEEQPPPQPSFSISPNPAGGSITIRHGLQSGIVAIYNLLGEKVYERKIEGENPLNIDVSEWRSGVYLCVLRGGNGIITDKMVIIR